MDRKIKKWVFWVHSALLGVPGIVGMSHAYDLCWIAMLVLFAGYGVLVYFVTREIFGK